MIKPITVELMPYELDLAKYIGTKRYEEAIRQGKKDCHGFKGDGLSIHINGASGELAFAKCLNLYYSGSVNTFKEGGDVGEIQIRTRSRDDYDLIVRRHDRDNDIFVLVIGGDCTFNIYGYILGKDAKRQEFYQTYGNRPGAFFVPKERLNSIIDLYKQTAIKQMKFLKMKAI